MARRIVLTSVGSFGDLHPFIATGLALKARGFEAVSTPTIRCNIAPASMASPSGLDAIVCRLQRPVLLTKGPFRTFECLSDPQF